MTQNNFKKAIYKLNLTNITPLHIGNGKFLHPNSELLELKGRELAIKNTAYVSNDTPQEISEFINTHGKVFIPGSSIKGAFRSAYLHHWLETGFGKKQLKKWLNEVLRIVEQYNDLPDDRKKRQLKKTLANIERGYRRGGETIYYGFENLIENPCFGSRKDYGKWNNLRLRDSNSKDQSTAIYELKRYYLQSEHVAIPTFVEALIPNQKFEVILHYVKDNDTINNNIVGSKLNQVFKNTDTITSHFNRHSLALINYELKVLDYDDVENDYIKAYEDTLKQIKQEIETNTNAFYFRLGAGKLQFYQTVAIAIYNIDTDDEDWNGEVWGAYLDYVSKFKEFEADELFPKTRVLTMDGKLPLGWIKVEYST